MINMMMVPRRNSFDLLEDMFHDSFFSNHESKVMKTDIKEKESEYEISVDLPGYEKDNIQMSIEDGYLTISATIVADNKDEEDGKFVRRERYSGSCARSFFVGEEVNSEDIKASFKNGILKVSIPKKQIEEKETKKYIQIED